ncbi:hypothetical protein [Stenotrophomonas phage BUCTxx100]|nr:hypothetical protein [Stenotrophomonas phage BUCTxx100]
MKKPTKHPVELEISKLSNNSCADSDLADEPARLFRKLLRKLNMNVDKLCLLMNEYVKWTVTGEDEAEIRKRRSYTMGNIKDTYFKNPTLTFSKLIEGLSILRMSKVEVILRVYDKKGNVTEVSETVRIISSPDDKKDD